MYYFYYQYRYWWNTNSGSVCTRLSSNSTVKYAHDIHNRLVSLCKHLSSSLHTCRVIVSIVSRIKNTHYVSFPSVFILKVSRQEIDATSSTENVLGPMTRRPVKSTVCLLGSTAVKGTLNTSRIGSAGHDRESRTLLLESPPPPLQRKKNCTDLFSEGVCYARIRDGSIFDNRNYIFKWAEEL
jgi:hypothetical protein